MDTYQRNRIYSLVVGTEEDAVEINNLNIRFNIVKTSSNKDKKNNAYVEIFNLSESRRKALEEDYVQVSLKVGYSDTGLKELFSGQVVNVSTTEIDPFLTKRQGTDLITRLTIDELYERLNAQAIKGLIPAGKTVKDVINFVSNYLPEVARKDISGEKVKTSLIDGYPISGTPRKILDDLSKAYGIEWQIDMGVLYVSDEDGNSDNKQEVYSVGQFSGLIERPEFISNDSKKIKKKNKNKKDNLKFKILLNPEIIAGSIIKLEFEDLTGYYRVSEVTHAGEFRGTQWYSTIIARQKVD
jgi:hypothetical protein